MPSEQGLGRYMRVRAKQDAAAVPDLDDFLAGTVEKKADQPTGHVEQAILAVDAMFKDGDDLRLAFDRSPVPVPWWRVYQVLRSDAALVYEGSG